MSETEQTNAPAAATAAGSPDATAGPAGDAPSSAGAGDEVVPGAPVERKLSALRDNIKEKGQYSYYYGHTMDTPEVRAEREAALRIQEAQRGGAAQPIKTQVVVQKSKRPISQYSWSDGKKRVTIYIPTENIAVPESAEAEAAQPEGEEEAQRALALSHTINSVELVVTDTSNQCHLFQVPRLYDEISKAVVKFSNEKQRITISLTKKSAFSWANLHRQ